MTPQNAPDLLDYQLHTNEVLIPEALRRGVRRLGVVSPCGSGKSTKIADLCRRAASKGNTVTVIAHRRKLVQQLSERLQQYGVRYSVEMADLPDEPWAVRDYRAEIIVGSMQTLESRLATSGVRSSRVAIPDEAHTIDTAAYQSVLKAIAPEFTLGFTATLCKGDGRGFGPKVFDGMVTVTTIEALIAREVPRLVQTDVFVPMRAGKRRAKGLDSGIQGDPVAQWMKHASGLRTVSFCRTLDECRAVRDMFDAEGIKALVIDAHTPDEERDEAISNLADREILVLVCTPSLMGVGVDIPFLECVQLLVKNVSPITQWQTVGRVQRVAEGKERAVLLDHAGAVFQHGDPNHSPVWTLDENDSVQNQTQKRMEQNQVDFKPSVCKACGCMSVGARRCPKCNELLVREGRKNVATGREQLQAMGDLSAEDGPNLACLKAWRSILFTCVTQGVTCDVASRRFQGKFGVWPDVAKVHPLPAINDRHRKVSEALPAFARGAKK